MILYPPPYIKTAAILVRIAAVLCVVKVILLLNGGAFYYLATCLFVGDLDEVDTVAPSGGWYF
jgi:hypothetical protein